MITKNEARKLIRKAVHRVPEGEEIRHLNIMPMMDMMTILLVAMIAQVSEATSIITNVDLAASQSQEKFPEEATTLTIAKEIILLDGKPIITLNDGDVDSSLRAGGSLGINITKLSYILGGVRAEYEQKRIDTGKVKPGDKPPVPELFIIADKSTPYKLLFSVIASARAKEAGYERFRLIVMKKSGTTPAE